MEEPVPVLTLLLGALLTRLLGVAPTKQVGTVLTLLLGAVLTQLVEAVLMEEQQAVLMEQLTAVPTNQLLGLLMPMVHRTALMEELTQVHIRRQEAVLTERVMLHQLALPTVLEVFPIKERVAVMPLSRVSPLTVEAACMQQMHPMLGMRAALQAQ